MTPGQIIQWLREAGAYVEIDYPSTVRSVSITPDELVHFAQLVASHKQEQCAKVCREVSAASGSDKYDMFGNDLAEQCETAIRALKD
jgi:hypothetical protein